MIEIKHTYLLLRQSYPSSNRCGLHHMRDQRLNTTHSCAIIISYKYSHGSFYHGRCVGVYTWSPVMFVHLIRNSCLENENTRMEASSREQFVEYLARATKVVAFQDTLVRACTNQISFSMKPKEVIEVRNILALCC